MVEACETIWLKYSFFVYHLRLQKEPSCCMDVGTLAANKGCGGQ